MRLDKIHLSWFRGAAESGDLDLNSKNLVVYGSNASGKSTFVDAIEYVINKGKIRHLSHEYSGTRQELGIRNTHTPDGTSSKCEIYFDDGSCVSADIKPSGTFILKSDPPDLLERVQSWALENHLLRQDEVSDFIHLTKGRKYSILLPLLGLDDLEFAAENLKRLKNHVAEQSKVELVNNKLTYLIARVKSHCGSGKQEDVLLKLQNLAKKYLGMIPTGDILDISCALIERASKSENTRYTILDQILNENLDKKLEEAISARENAEGVVGTILDRQISVLESTLAFTDALEDLNKEVPCPSCGQMVMGVDLANHVQKELNSLEKDRELRDAAAEKCNSLAMSIKETVKKSKDLSSWLESGEQERLANALSNLEKIEVTDPLRNWDKSDFKVLKDNIPKVVLTISEEIEEVPSSVKELLDDLKAIEAGSTFPSILVLQNYVTRIESLLNALETCEHKVRSEIRSRTERTIREISSEIQGLWSKLHPDEPIEEARLYIPGEMDKAIDIAIKFFGVDQPSPRLTLSESHRNSLGLCIFLALAMLKASPDHPIILDDIVSSLDREHRGRIADILMEDLSDRQVVLFTHDREWYNELRFRLPSNKWKFLVLRPWENPKIGLRWSRSAYTFDEARDLVTGHPEASGNRTRSIMDEQLAIAAERLRLSMPFLRGDRNDRRTCIDFLNRILGETPSRFRKKEGNRWVPFPDPISEWKNAKNLLIAWGDRSSHTGTLTIGEARKLIEACEKALESFRCPSCGDYIWLADQTTRERLQCSCGQLQWRYG
ncbi:hypothetical protein KAU88_04050 [Candidatus Bathyarchaeota archaeon]|nr:hypothetical protein [Candidatus Bathyarchaeota archaeon]